MVATALRRPIVWTRTGNVHEPFRAQIDGQRWVLRLGDFPAEALYTLIVDGREIGSLDTLPDVWTRPIA